MPKIQKTKQGLFIYLPKEYTQLLGWNKGDTCAIYPDRQAKATLILSKTLDAVTKEPQQSVNAYKEAPPVKLEISQAPRPIQQAPRPQPQSQPKPAMNLDTSSINPDRLRELIRQRQQGQ